ncbi:hypothetical protein PVK06_005138 [Gossypium arboreum]|uniref:Uncharacterized protein n=1 Tax=Gossypium arboreum TaxID=29729 RepID=A0ABR0QUS6_GOSAR|nr:hypothetical protein PVK06_005138 [Gossypium arboreum]
MKKESNCKKLNVLEFEILSSSIREKEGSPEPTKANPPTEDMYIENLDTSSQNPNTGDNANGDFESKRMREEIDEETKDESKRMREEIDEETKDVFKKLKLDKSVEEKRLEKKSNDSSDSSRVRLSPKDFSSSFGDA